MLYQELKTFITEDMRMSHIYQPVMLIELLKHNGEASVEQIAQAILNRDPTQIEYYSEIVNGISEETKKDKNSSKQIFNRNFSGTICERNGNDGWKLINN